MALLQMLVAGHAYAESKKLCGWVDNPTPGNWWLTDATQEWTISTQGGVEAENSEAISNMSLKEWVPKGQYGFGCACITATTDAKNARITRIISVKQLPLARCENDKALPHKGRDPECNKFWQATYLSSTGAIPFNKEAARLIKKCEADL